MKISQMIEELERIRAEHGDLEVAWRGAWHGGEFADVEPDVDVQQAGMNSQTETPQGQKIVVITDR